MFLHVSCLEEVKDTEVTLHTHIDTEMCLGLTCLPPPHVHPAGERCLPCLEPRELGNHQRSQVNQRGGNVPAGTPQGECRIPGSAGPWPCSAWAEAGGGGVHCRSWIQPHQCMPGGLGKWWQGPCTHFPLGSQGDATGSLGVVPEQHTQGAGGDRH